jgi:SAM-dependent methyltransferase
MDPREVAASYEQLAESYGVTVGTKYGMAQHERALAFVRNKRRALDIGCGSSGRIIDLLQRSGFEVEGVDISAGMLELAKRRHPEVTFHHADICEWKFPEEYDFVSAWDSIWHVPLQKQAPVLSRILQHLAPGGVCIFTTGGLDAPGEKVDAAMGPPMYYSVLGIPNTLRLLHETGCVCRHLEYDQYPELHVYIIAQRP